MNEELNYHPEDNSEKDISKEIILRKYIYRDHRVGGREGKIVFECDAANILEADKLYQEATGNDPEKQSYVGCESISKENINKSETPTETH